MKLRALLLLLAGFALRFWASGYARFTGDESHYWYVSRQLATFSKFPIYGPEITGSEAHLPGALYYYLMAVPQLFGSSPRFGAVAVILGHLGGAWLLYLLLLRVRGERAALFGLALAMVTPWEVLYSDRIWGSCVVPILGSIALYAAVRAQESARWQTILIVVNLVLPQLHLSSPVLWVACGAIVLLRRPKWNRKAVAIGLAVVLLAYAPMLIAELGRGFANTKLIFAKAGGKEEWSKSLLIPIEMLAYAILYGSAELSYHFGRGYWGGYDDVTRYATAAGWSGWLAREGIAIAALTIASIALSIALWTSSLASLARKIRRRDLGLEEVFFIGLLAGLAAGIALLMPARKAYFPHYANVLMPMLLWPLALGLDSAWNSKLRAPAIALFAVSLLAMVINVVRYYREVDGLNGLTPTLAMVGAALEEDRPIDVRFEHFNNAFAWNLIAKGVYGRDLPSQRGAVLRWNVLNGHRYEGEGPLVFGPVRVRREERTLPRPPGLLFRASEHWRTIEVIGKSTCKATTGDSCRYGDQPWQQLKPDAIAMRGRPEPVLFLHPITDRPVLARIPVAAGATRGLLHYGLSDGAHQSDNRAPVAVILRQGGHTLIDTTTEPIPGLKARPFTVTGTAALELEIRTANDGARVFGFDLDLF